MIADLLARCWKITRTRNKDSQIRIIILIIEDKWDINNLVGKGSNPQVVLFNLWIILAKTSQESGWNVSNTAVHTGIIVFISTNEYAGRHASQKRKIPFWYYEFSQ